MVLNANVLAAIEQVQLLDELKAISFTGSSAKIMYENLKITASFDGLNKDNE